MAKKGLLESIVSDMLGEGSVSTGDFLDTIEDALSDLAGNAASSGEGFIASDIPALLSHTRDVIFLQDKEIAVLNRQGISVFDAYGNHCHHPVFHVDWDLTSAEKGGYAHYMLKEIHEQPEAARKTAAPRLDVPEENWLPICPEEAKRLKKITIVACGTAYHAGIYGQYAIEKLARIPVEAAIASE